MTTSVKYGGSTGATPTPASFQFYSFMDSVSYNYGLYADTTYASMPEGTEGLGTNFYPYSSGTTINS